MIVTDLEGRVNFLNPVAEALTGWVQPRRQGKPLETVFRICQRAYPASRSRTPSAKVLRNGVICGLANHTVLLAKDGTERPIDDCGAPIRDEQGNVDGVVLVFRDVTEARRAVEARLHLAAIVESSDDAIISQSLDGNIVSWNQGARRFTATRPRRSSANRFRFWCPPDHPDELPALLDRIRRDERINHFETVRLRKDGSRVDVSLTISPVRNSEGTIVGASKIARDITDIKRHEQMLRFLSEASKVLAELIDVPSTLQKVAWLAVPHFADWCTVDMLDEEGNLRRLAVAHVDPAKVKLAHELHRRYPPDPAAPLGVWNVLRTGKAELVPEISDALLVETTTDQDLLRLLRELGLRSYLGVPLTMRGKTLGVLTFVAAESGRHFQPADLHIAEDLGQRAAVAIENARLFGDLKEADQRKDEFLAMLAHELRNPLAPIRNALQIMKMPGADGETVEQARQMTERQVGYMVRMVDDLLDVSRIMRGKIVLRKEPVELATLISQAIEMSQPMIDAQGQHLLPSSRPNHFGWKRTPHGWPR